MLVVLDALVLAMIVAAVAWTVDVSQKALRVAQQKEHHYEYHFVTAIIQMTYSREHVTRQRRRWSWR